MVKSEGKNPLFFRRRRLPYRRFREEEDRHRRGLARFFSLATLIVGLTYLLWLGRLVHRNHGWQDFLLLAAEILAFLLLALLALDIWRLRFHRSEGVAGSGVYSVDVLIPCCGEPWEILRTTSQAVAGISYSGPVQVYILDDANSPEVAALAASLKFNYLSRPGAGVPLTDAKSGNLNFGLSHSGGELILVLDADQVPEQDILTRMAGFFRFPQMAYVQSKQEFLLPEGDPFYNQDEIFYETVQLSNDLANAVISCGSGVLYRRQALKELGGFATWNLVEDLTTSYELLSRGWKGIYFPYALTRGLAPLTLAGVYRQRYQWALDTMRLFYWDNPLLKRGLSWRQRSHFLLIMVSYLLSGLALPAFYLMPLLVYWRGYSTLLGQETVYWGLRGAYLLATVLMFRYLFFRQNALKQFKMLCGLFPVYTMATVSALFYPPGRKPPYRVNNRQPFRATMEWWCLGPLLGLMLPHLILPFVSLSLGWALPRLIAFNALFSSLTIWVLAEMVMLSWSKPRWQPDRDPRLVYGV